MTRRTLVFVFALAIPHVVAAQSLGTFRWQLQPYCNVLTMTVVQNGSQYHLDGTDDQCGAARKASVVGLGFPNPDGTIGFGLTIVTTPGGAPIHVDTRISIATISGPWNDSAGGSGTFTFTPGAGTGGSPRPAASPTIPSTILLRGDGAVLAGGSFGGATLPAPGSGPGARMMWYPGEAAFRAGRVTGPAWDQSNIGSHSVAFGLDTVATGDASASFGQLSFASGPQSVAMGNGTSAIGIASTAMGTATTATGDKSLAAGEGTIASGIAAVALGRNTTAAGHYSLAMGSGSTTTALFGFAGGNSSTAGDTAFAFGQNASALGVGSVALGRAAGTTVAGAGSFMLADRSSSTPFVSNRANEFGARFDAGYYFYTSASLNSGAVMGNGANDWTALSDANAKENFRDVDGEELLWRLAGVPVREWNYRSQSAGIRHIGPTAQDFRAAFGLGDFPLRINTIDASGVALGGVRALEARTRGLPERTAALDTENQALRAEMAALRERLARLERLLMTPGTPTVATQGGR
jgi:hypothetical protein